jgi:DNA polymerase III delta subunit
MLTIICGEDSIASRNYFVDQEKLFREKNFEIVSLDDKQVLELDDDQASSSSLFDQKRIYFTSGLNKKVLKKLNQKTEKIFKKIVASKVIQLFNWEEDTTSRELKSIKGVIIKEFKPNQTIFKLLDSCYPGNLKNFMSSLKILSESTEDIFIFIMLARHIRNILITKLGERLPKLMSWQIYKLSNQAKFWQLENLINFYQGLHRIDVNAKTGGTPYSVKESLEILACFYLK